MTVFRCTQRVIRRFKITPKEPALASTGVLGDWYANLLNIGSTRLVLCQSERSLLPVILPARNKAFPHEFGNALRKVLLALGVPEERANAEVQATQDIQFAKTRSRQVLGVMNDFAFSAQFYLAHAWTNDPILEACLKLAETPSTPIENESPDRLTVALFRMSTMELAEGTSLAL